MKTITRAKYLDRIIELNGTPDIKIITGIRRSGKSKLMQAYIAYLKSNFENINIIFIDFMDLAYEEIKEYHALHAYVEEHYQEGKTNYLFVDEVQMCPKFELAINSLYSKGKYDIYHRQPKQCSACHRTGRGRCGTEKCRGLRRHRCRLSPACGMPAIPAR